MNNLLWFLGKTFHTRWYYSKAPLPASADLKCRSHSKTNRKNIKMYKLLEIDFFQLLILVGFCLFLFKWARSRDVAGVKVNGTRRHKSNIVFMDQGTCISFSKGTFSPCLFYPAMCSTPLLPNRFLSLPSELLLASAFRLQAWSCLLSLLTILFQVFMV